MTEKPPTRETLHIRLRPGVIAWIDQEAQREQRTRSDMARILLQEAIDARVKKGRTR